MSTAAVLIAAPSSAPPRTGSTTTPRHGSTGPAEDSFAAALGRVGAQPTSQDPAPATGPQSPDIQDEALDQTQPVALPAALLLAAALPTQATGIAAQPPAGAQGAAELTAPGQSSTWADAATTGTVDMAPGHPLAEHTQGTPTAASTDAASDDAQTPAGPGRAAVPTLVDAQPLQGATASSPTLTPAEALEDHLASGQDQELSAESTLPAERAGALPATSDATEAPAAAAGGDATTDDAAPAPRMVPALEADTAGTVQPLVPAQPATAASSTSPTPAPTSALTTTQAARPEPVVALSALPERISEHVQAITSGTDRVALRLSPSHLGSVQLVLTHTPDGVAVVVRADSSALASLAGIERSVRATLEHSGAPIASFTFDASTSERHTSEHHRERMPAREWPEDAGRADSGRERYAHTSTPTASTEILL